MNIKEDIKLQEFLDTIGASEATRKSYITHLGNFCECVGKTPSELIEESVKEMKEGLLPAERKSKEYVAKFKRCMQEKGLASKSQSAAMAALKSFFKTNDMPLSESVARMKKAAVKEENKGFLKREDIIKLLINAKNLREKAIILCMATSGMAIQEIINLKVWNIKFDENNNIGIITMRREKSQTDFTTFISPEAVNALKNYWDERERNGDKLKKESYAFVSYSNRNKSERLHPVGISKAFNTMGMQLGYENGEGFIKSRSHALRKYFASTLEDNGFPKPKIDFMMGHTVTDLDTAYFNRDPTKLKELYIEALEFLTFEKELVVKTLDKEELEALKNENMLLQTRITELEANKNFNFEEDNKKLRDELGAMQYQHQQDIEAMRMEFQKVKQDQMAFYEFMKKQAVKK